ncbi:MAG: TlpA disulfide reductase family protein [Herminiimonas sp.]|uniref:TlpA family protein disulfide reductase n=1 Tax=Herminiimonas sp. TaxID=1926289 RepID=UPI00271FB486|nr:TlpA disulfide reductase family protein [Herminiimonas sp.]MDO9420252.1 TlpA disulfide reductase family protein [Herminiimonas sp.]
MTFIKKHIILFVLSCVALLCASTLQLSQAADLTGKDKQSQRTQESLDTAKPAVVNEGESRARSAGQSLIGAPGPYLKLKTIDGKTIALGKLYGKQPIYLKFWATWCIPCREQMPGFEKIYQQDGKRIKVIAVNAGFSDNEAAVREFKKKIAMHMPIVIDNGDLAAAFNVRVTPTHVLIDTDGRIAHIGHLEDDKFHAALKRVMAGETAATEARRSGAKPAQQAVLKPGDVVTDLNITTTDGKTISLATTSGKPRALVFTAPWCESYLAQSRPAVSQACKRVRLEAEQLAKTGNVEWLAIASGLWASEQDLLDYQKLEKIEMPLALDASGRIFRAFDIRQIPSIVLIDANNRIVQILGPNDVTLKKAVQSLQRK